MPLGLGPRFVVEAAFLIAVAVAAAMLDLTTPAIVAVMAGAWSLVAAVEWLLSRRAGVREAATVAPAEREPAPPPAPEPEPVVAPEALPEPVEPEPVAVTAAARPEEEPTDETPPALPEPVPPAAEERVELTVVPEPEPEPEPEPVRRREPPRAAVVNLDDARPWEPREWNIWELERAAREVAGDDAVRDEERSFLLMYLRDFAGPDGSLPTRFDSLVRDSFGDVLGSGTR